MKALTTEARTQPILSLRDWLAGQILPYCAEIWSDNFPDDKTEGFVETVCDQAYMWADAMLEARSK